MCVKNELNKKNLGLYTKGGTKGGQKKKCSGSGVIVGQRGYSCQNG